MTSRELFRVLRGRRDRILGRWLTRLSPLTDPAISGDRVCVEDRAIAGGIRGRDRRRFSGRAWIFTEEGDALEERAIDVDPGEGSRVCAAVPGVHGASASRPACLVIDLVASTPGLETTHPLRIHAYHLGDDVRIAGVKRPGAPR